MKTRRTCFGDCFVLHSVRVSLIKWVGSLRYSVLMGCVSKVAELLPFSLQGECGPALLWNLYYLPHTKDCNVGLGVSTPTQLQCSPADRREDGGGALWSPGLGFIVAWISWWAAFFPCGHGYVEVTAWMQSVARQSLPCAATRGKFHVLDPAGRTHWVVGEGPKTQW